MSARYFAFSGKGDVKQRFEDCGYIANNDIEITVHNAVKLGMPLLVDGPAGVGKTEIAKVLSSIFDTDLVRVQCYEGIDFTKVLYDYNYSKQILYLNVLKDNVKSLLEGKSFSDAVKSIQANMNFYGEDFLLERPLLRALTSVDKPKVLLIDEIDKADMEFEAFLLEMLSDYSITIPEYKTITATPGMEPLVVLTSNNMRELGEPLKRRCIYLYIDYPSIDQEAQIIRSKVPEMDYDFSGKIARAVNMIRSLNLKQKPSVAESIMWAKSLMSAISPSDFSSVNKDLISSHLNILLKNRGDIQKAAGSSYLG